MTPSRLTAIRVFLAARAARHAYLAAHPAWYEDPTTYTEHSRLTGMEAATRYACMPQALRDAWPMWEINAADEDGHFYLPMLCAELGFEGDLDAGRVFWALGGRPSGFPESFDSRM